MGGLGLVRLRQARHEEARALFDRAAALEPKARDKWEGLARTARFWGLLAQARAAREAQRFDAAEALAREARSLDLKEEAAAVNKAMEDVLNSGNVTADLKPKGTPATTEQVGKAVCEAIG